jgi:SAM-dependent methyltransferase
MQTFRRLVHEYEFDLPDRFDGDPRTPASYVEHFLSEFTAEGDVVLDPFAGFGTTLRVAERMGREAYGVEYDAEVASVAREHVEHPDRVFQGDALDATSYSDLPRVDCCFTSPPFMVEEMPEDPLTNYTESGRPYDEYIADLGRVFDHVDDRLASGGHLLVDVSNMKFDGRVTTLAWDVADVARERFRFDGEVVVTWTADESGRDHGEGTYGYGYDHSYCLVFQQDDATPGGDAAQR